MPHKTYSWQFILDCLQAGVRVALLYVVSSKGSSPGRRGFIMAVDKNGITNGSIGGGIMEIKFIEMAKAYLNKGQPFSQLYPQVHNKTASKNQSGMICSGEQTNLIHIVQRQDIAAIKMLVYNISMGNPFFLRLSPAGIETLPVSDNIETGLVFSDTSWHYAEFIESRPWLIIIGGGHCSHALSRQMKMLDFKITVYEDRESLPTLDGNSYADEKIILEDYSELATLIDAYNNTYVVVMTVGYRTDDKAIRALIGKPFSYVGILGSKEKIMLMLKTYRHEGLNPEWINKLYAPAGLPIASKTPEEIATSIAAQIISVINCLH